MSTAFQRAGGSAPVTRPHASTLLFVGAVMLLLGGRPHPASAQGVELRRGLEVAAFAGRMSHSLLGDVEGNLVTTLGLLDVTSDVEAEATNAFGAGLGWRLSPSFTLRARGARGDTHVRLVARAGPAGGASYQYYTFSGLGEIQTWLVDAGLAWEPLAGREGWAAPFLVGGIGFSKWDITGLEDLGALPPLLETPVNLSPVHATLPAFSIGGGVTFSPATRVRLVAELRDHISANPLADDDFRLGTSFTGFGRAKDLVHSLTITFGVRAALGS